MPDGSLYKRCGCRDPHTRQALGSSCPKLRRPGGGWHTGHGRWHYQLELPPTADGRRRQLRRGGFTTKDAAETDRDHARNLLAAAGDNPHARGQIADLLQTCRSHTPLPAVDTIRQRVRAGITPAGVPTVAQWLHQWLANHPVDPDTARQYEGKIRNYLVPHLGHLQLDELRVGHIKTMLATLQAHNAELTTAKASHDPQVRASVRGRRVLSPRTFQLIRAVLRAALNDAIAEELITTNPARHVKIPGARPTAREWTPERVAAWRATGIIPSPVMIWTPTQTGQFLDHAAHDPLYPLFRLIALRGLRRGEACGLRRGDLDLPGRRLTVANQLCQHGYQVVQKKPKSRAGDRTIALDDTTVDLLQDHLQCQDQLAARLGIAWHDSGLVFTRPDGQPLHPQAVTKRFQQLTREAGLPPIRLHDLRHVAASIAHAAGTDLKSISKLLGHSTITITADTYTEVFTQLDHTQAAASAAIIPLKDRRRAAA